MAVQVAIESSGTGCSVAVDRHGRLFYEHVDEARQQARRLLPMVDNQLNKAGLSAGDIDRVICPLGPGSFTGLRVAASYAQGLAWSVGCSLLGVCSLHATALAAIRRYPELPDSLWVVIDARMNQVYTASFERQSDSRLAVLSAPALETLDSLVVTPGAAVIGSGAALIKGDSALSFGDVEADARDLLAMAELAGPVAGAPARELELVYLRNRVAWQSGGDSA